VGLLKAARLVRRLSAGGRWIRTPSPPHHHAVRALRLKTASPVPLARWEIRSVLASLCDGAGAQSLFALTKRGRRFALASLLVKTEVGVADAWVREGMTKAEADALIAQIVAAAEAVEVSIALLEGRLADALAINVACNLPPIRVVPGR
jgi:hypothetical protein